MYIALYVDGCLYSKPGQCCCRRLLWWIVKLLPLFQVVQDSLSTAFNSSTVNNSWLRAVEVCYCHWIYLYWSRKKHNTTKRAANNNLPPSTIPLSKSDNTTNRLARINNNRQCQQAMRVDNNHSHHHKRDSMNNNDNNWRNRWTSTKQQLYTINFKNKQTSWLFFLYSSILYKHLYHPLPAYCPPFLGPLKLSFHQR